MHNIERSFFSPNIEPSLEERLEQHPDIISDELEEAVAPPSESPDVNKPEKLDRVAEPPVLEHQDMVNRDGEVIDFSQAENYHQLIDMINEAGSVTNGLGQELPAETVINLIYKLTYQDLADFKKEDWTNITLRHNLRATVARLIEGYKQTNEFIALAGLDLSNVTSVEEIVGLLGQNDKWINANGTTVSANEMASYIHQGHLTSVPEPIRFKVIELNKQTAQRQLDQEQRDQLRRIELASNSSQSTLGRISSGLSKLKFWDRK